MTTEAMESWGWRIPFLLGGIIGPVGLYMRRNIAETPAYEEAKKQPEVLSSDEPQPSPVTLAAKAFGFAAIWNVIYYIFLSYFPTFSTKYLGLTRSESLWSNSTGLVTLIVAIPLMGLLSDYVGRRPLLLFCCLFFIFLPYPLFSYMLSGPSFALVVGMQILFGIVLATFGGPGPAAISEIFPTRIRSTWMSTGYSLAAATFGGFAPFIATWLIEKTHDPISPVYFVMGTAVFSGLVILSLRETAKKRLG